jgi:hypothetical protein
MFFLYILKLTNNKYYIGKSRNKRTLENRLRNHFNRGGAVWTKRHKPLEVIAIQNIIDEKYMEDRKVFEYMNLYGIENVRGGSFCKVKLSNEETSILKRIINTEEDTCFICNSADHMSAECNQKKNKKNKYKKNKYKKNRQKNKQFIIDDTSEETSEEISEDHCINKPLSCCQKFFNFFSVY